MGKISTWTTIASAPLLWLQSGCWHAPPPADPVFSAETARPEPPSLPLEASTGPQKPRTSRRHVGDVWVHRFSGSYRAEPLILKEEVLEKRGNVFVVDYLLSSEKSRTHLRVELTSRSERIVSVKRIEDGRQHPATVADYEEMIEQTTFVPERNQGKISQKAETCLVGKAELDCEIASFRVQVGDEPATLSVARTQDLKRDVAGEVRAVDGTVLYHAELIEMRAGEERPASPEESVARNDWDPYEKR